VCSLDIFTIVALAVSAVCVFLMVFSLLPLVSHINIANRKSGASSGVVDSLNHNDFVAHVGNAIPGGNLSKLFFMAKNPWGMTVATFQFIRYAGLIFCVVVAVAFAIAQQWQTAAFAVLIGFLFWWYPMYFYRGTAAEREQEWNKMYEYIWVLKHNAMLFDAAKTFLNVRIYLQEHAPQDAELIQGFDDFYKHWDPKSIPKYVEQYYPFPVAREIFQIMFNMNKTGEFPEDNLNNLRKFIINAENLTVEKTLSNVAGKATLFSLPFLMLSVIVALLVPLIMQVMNNL
jgi:hypothetical protein